MKHYYDSLRPITLKVLIEVLSKIEQNEISYLKKKFTKNRLHEILSQLRNMRLIEYDETLEVMKSTERGRALLDAFKKEDRSKMHIIMLSWEPYRRIYELLRSGAYSFYEISRKLEMNIVVVDTIIRLMKSIGIPIGRDDSNRLYLEKSIYEIDLKYFLNMLLYEYKLLVKRHSNKYIPLPELRRSVCSRIRISKETFNEALKRLLDVELNTFITLTSAPVSVRREEGLKIRGKHFYYIYIEE